MWQVMNCQSNRQGPITTQQCGFFHFTSHFVIDLNVIKSRRQATSIPLSLLET